MPGARIALISVAALRFLLHLALRAHPIPHTSAAVFGAASPVAPLVAVWAVGAGTFRILWWTLSLLVGFLLAVLALAGPCLLTPS